ncbi:MAG: hypothetical protein TQ37_01410 [Candidatus Synechococcus spongiarum 15L]|uniref:Uncharacterized protein n=1 Tax=Candidatus Synechococcus spongiarum 15L TaxID=1608419 RepID=A0A0G8AYU1_9SYNE|nr:MAG: hypothetical protein TQ37_01410 [Candidatus Synechococcus spongiarum 15L]
MTLKSILRPDWSISKNCSNAVCEIFLQFLKILIFPYDAIVLANIKMNVLKTVFMTCKNYRNTETMGKSCFIVDAATCPFFILSKVCYHKSGSTYLSNDFIINFVDMVFLINYKWFISGIFNC